MTSCPCGEQAHEGSERCTFHCTVSVHDHCSRFCDNPSDGGYCNECEKKSKDGKCMLSYCQNKRYRFYGCLYCPNHFNNLDDNVLYHMATFGIVRYDGEELEVTLANRQWNEFQLSHYSPNF